MEREEQNVDRLSDLPDDVICRILSLLETQNSVQTSVLSKRWTTLWAHVPVLVFYNSSGSSRKSFAGMVCAFMLRHRAQTLTTCRLICPDEDDDDVGPCYEVETCIAAVVERNIQVLDLWFRVELPRCLLNCSTLVDLTLSGDVTISPSAPTSLPALKKLCLYGIECEAEFTRLLSGCPVLEELEIELSKFREPRSFYISSLTLKRLTIHQKRDRSMLNNTDYMVTIKTPALRYLKVCDNCSYKYFSILLCTSLVEAEIGVDGFCELDDFDRLCVLKFLESIRHVKCLELSVSWGKIYDGRMNVSIAKFGNLTELEWRAPWSFLPKFFESADHLQVLTIFEDSVGSDEHWMDPIEEPSECLLHSLRTVTIDGFKCTEQGFNMVKYILRNARVLECMEISFPRRVGVDSKERFDTIRIITQFHRESRECELHFS